MNSRELVAWAQTLDGVLSRRFPEATDTIVQRMKAIEASQRDGGWQVAEHQHLEIFPDLSTSAASLDEKAKRMREDAEYRENFTPS